MKSFVPEYHLVQPDNLATALGMLAAAPAHRPIAGGTDLMVLFNAGKLPHRHFVSIRALPELRSIEVTREAVVIGAASTYTNLRRHPVLQAEFPLLVQSASWTGGIANQNRGTLGGNLANASPAADSAPVLLVYEAELELVSMRGTRRLPYSRFHTGYKQTQLEPDELIAAIRLPRRPASLVRHHGRKVGTRKAQAIAKVSFAALSAGPRSIRIAIGSVAPIPVRCLKTEALLHREPLTRSLIAQAREVLLTDIQPISDIRSTSDYRTLVSQNLLEEFLTAL